jgi:hypothetical protein
LGSDTVREVVNGVSGLGFAVLVEFIGCAVVELDVSGRMFASVCYGSAKRILD